MVANSLHAGFGGIGGKRISKTRLSQHCQAGSPTQVQFQWVNVGEAVQESDVLGDQLRELRVARCWSQAHLADAAALNVRTVQRIEAGEPCSYETMMSLAAALGVDVEEFERGSAPKKALAYTWRLAAASVCLLPLLLFVVLNLLRSLADVGAPYNATASIGSKIMSLSTFNMVSPALFVGGGVAALFISTASFLGIRKKKDGATLSITALEVTADWRSAALALTALSCLAVFVSYEVLEQLFTAVH
jgi:transcriptional regulator with XRE-family HTH domain